MEEVKSEKEKSSEISGEISTDVSVENAPDIPSEDAAPSSAKEGSDDGGSSPEKKKSELSHGDNRIVTIISRILTVLLLAGCTVLGVVGYRRGAFSSVDALQEWMRSYGFWAPLMFIILQTVQVIIPIIPGGVTLLGGVLLFGPWWGFVYNYIGIILGSFAVFAISRNYGKPLMYRLFKRESIEKYEQWTSNHGRFAKLFAVAIFLPGAPDGLICYLAGTTEMSWKTYSLIILIAKPASIALYSVLYLLGINSLQELLEALKR